MNCAVGLVIFMCYNLFMKDIAQTDNSTKRANGLPATWDTRTKHSIITWLAILLGLTSLGVAILWMTNVDISRDFSIAIIINAYAAPIGAVVASAIFFKLAGLKDLLRGVLRWRVDVRWYLLAIFGPLVLVLLGNLLYMAVGGKPDWKMFFDFSVLSFGIGPIIAGCFEEIAWRGFAQRLLQQRYAALTAAVLVGIMWSTWHLWPLVAPGGAAQFAIADIIQTYVRLIATAIIYAWIYNGTKGSILLVMLAHAGHNVAIYLMPAPDHTIALIIAGLYAVAAAAVVRIAGARTLGAQ